MRRNLLACVVLGVVLPAVGSAASQLTPFFEKLAAIQGSAARTAFLKEELLCAEALDPAEEIGALTVGLESPDALVRFVAGQYVATLAHHERMLYLPMREAYRPALGLAAAHFNDPSPDPAPSVTAIFWDRPTWPRIALEFLEWSGLPMPEPMIQPAIQAVLHPDFNISRRAIWGLARLQPLPASVLKSLIEAARNSTGVAPREILEALSRAEVSDPAFIALVMDKLAGSDVESHRAALSAIGRLGAAAPPDALPLLRKMAAQPGGENASSARSLVERLETGKFPPAWKEKDPEAPSKVALMRVRPYFEFLKNAPPKDREALMQQDIHNLPEFRIIVPGDDLSLLIDLVKGDDPDLAACAASHLWMLGARYTTGFTGTKVRERLAVALPALAARFGDPNPPLLQKPYRGVTRIDAPARFWRRETLGFIWMSGAQAPSALLPGMLDALDDDDLSSWAVHALLEQKPLPDQLIPRVSARIAKGPEGVADSLIESMSKAGIRDPVFVRALGAVLDRPDASHSAAAGALARLGKDAKPAEESLRRFVPKLPLEQYAQRDVLAALKAIDGN